MSIISRLTSRSRPGAPIDVITHATSTIRHVDDVLADLQRTLNQPTQPTNVVEDHALRTLAHAVQSARVALRRIPR